MQIRPVPASRITADWAWLGPKLAPAVQFDKSVTLDDVRAKLASKQCELARITVPNGDGWVVSELCEDDGVICCWLSYLSGDVQGGPRAFLKLMRSIISEYEAMAKKAGADEMRIGGRNWSRVFPDYERFDDKPNRLRKRL